MEGGELSPGRFKCAPILLPRIRGLVGTRTSREKRLPSSRHPNFDVGHFGFVKETNFWLKDRGAAEGEIEKRSARDKYLLKSTFLQIGLCVVLRTHCAFHFSYIVYNITLFSNVRLPYARFSCSIVYKARVPAEKLAIGARETSREFKTFPIISGAHRDSRVQQNTRPGSPIALPRAAPLPTLPSSATPAAAG